MVAVITFDDACTNPPSRTCANYVITRRLFRVCAVRGGSARLCIDKGEYKHIFYC